MLKVKTKIGKSRIHGTGLFAAQFIPKGTITWEYSPTFDMDISEKDINLMSSINKEYFIYYSYFDKKRNKFILCADNQRFINHTTSTKKENIISTPDMDVAFRDIEIGEELLCDYNKFDSDYFKRMNISINKLI